MRVRVTLNLQDSSVSKSELVDPNNWDDIVHAFKRNLCINPKRLFLQRGMELTPSNISGMITQGTVIVATKGDTVETKHGSRSTKRGALEKKHGPKSTSQYGIMPVTNQSPSLTSKFYTGQEVYAMWEGDGRFYNARIEAIMPDSITITYVEYNEKATIPKKQVMKSEWNIDGSTMEGGGQVLRNAVIYGALLGETTQVYNVRGGRRKPGLRSQHLAGLQLAAELAGAELLGGKVESMIFSFLPPDERIWQRDIKNQYLADAITAGSVCLLLQVALPLLLFAPHPVCLTLKGGTNASFAPQIEYTESVLQHVLTSQMGITFSLNVERRGFFPDGGGVVNVNVSPVEQCIQPIQMNNRGNLIKITGIAITAGVVNKNVAALMIKIAETNLRGYAAFSQIPIDINPVWEQLPGRRSGGAGLLLFAHTDTGCVLCGSCIGSIRSRGEKEAYTASNKLIEEWQHMASCVDAYLQDQLIIFMALAKGTSSIICGPITLHTKTAIHFAKELTGAKFDIQPLPRNKGNDCFLITCEGIGLAPTTVTQTSSSSSSSSRPQRPQRPISK